MGRYDGEINHVKEKGDVIKSTIINTLNDNKLDKQNAYELKKNLYNKRVFNVDYWSVYVNQFQEGCFKIEFKLDTEFDTIIYAVPYVKPEQDEFGTTLSYSLSDYKTVFFNKARYDEYMAKYERLITKKAATLQMNPKDRAKYDAAVANYKKMKADIRAYINEISDAIAKCRSMDMYIEVIGELIKDSPVSEEDAAALIRQRYNFDSKDYLTFFKVFKDNALREINSNYIPFKRDVDDYSGYVKKYKNLALIALTKDYIVRTNKHQKDKLIKDLNLEEINKTISLKEALENIDVTDIFLANVLRHYKEPNAIINALDVLKKGQYKYEELKKYVSYLFKISYSILHVNDLPIEEFKLLFTSLVNGGFKLSKDYVKSIQCDHEKYDVLVDILKSAGLIKLIAHNTPLDVRSKYYYKVEVWAKYIKVERGKNICAFKECDASVLEKLQSVKTDFNLQSNKAEMKVIRFGDPGKSFVFEFLAFEDPSDWDGRKLGLITRLANEEFKSSGDSEIIRFAYSKTELEEIEQEEIDASDDDDDGDE